MPSKNSNETTHEQSRLASLKAIEQFVLSIVPMEQSDLELLAPILQYKLVKKNEYLLKEGEVCKNIYFLAKGLVRMFFVNLSGSEVNYRFTYHKTFFVDFQSFLTEQPTHFFWQAMEESEFLVLPGKEIKKIYSDSKAWDHFGRLIAERVYLQMNERVEMLLFMSPEERYNHLLNAQPELFNLVSQFHLSSYLGVKPESLSRLRKRLQNK